MSGERRLEFGRRQFLAGGALATGIAAATGGMIHAADAAGHNAGARAVFVHDPRHPVSTQDLDRLGVQGARIVTLSEDPVRFWRSAEGAALRDPSARLMGMTGWAELLLIRGLAAETRRHVRHEHYEPVTGTFVWLIA